MLLKPCHHGVVVITSVLHAEGPWFEPARWQKFCEEVKVYGYVERFARTQQFSSKTCNGLVAVEMISPWCKIKDCQKFFTGRTSAVRARVVTKVLRRSESLWICWTLCMNATEFSSSMCNGLRSVEMIAPGCKIRDCQICFTCRMSAVRDQGDKYFVRNESMRICWKICMNATKFIYCICNGLAAVETMSPWCSGYHICLTRRRSAVRARVVTKVLRRSESLWIFWTLCMNATEFSSSMCNGLRSVEMIAPGCKIRDCQICFSFTCRMSAVQDQGDKYFVRNESIRICWKICMNATEFRSCIWNGLDAVEIIIPWCSGYHICLTRKPSAVRARVVTKVLRRSESIWICWTLCMNVTI